MVGAAHELVVAGQRRELVDRAPGHVQGDEVAHQQRAEHRGQQREPVTDAHLLAHLRRARRAGGHRRRAIGQPRLGRDLEAVGAQEVRERLAVPQLLVDPAREERRDVGIVRRPGWRAGRAGRSPCGSRCPSCSGGTSRRRRTAGDWGCPPSRSASDRPSWSCARSGRCRTRPRDGSRSRSCPPLTRRMRARIRHSPPYGPASPRAWPSGRCRSAGASCWRAPGTRRRCAARTGRPRAIRSAGGCSARRAWACSRG